VFSFHVVPNIRLSRFHDRATVRTSNQVFALSMITLYHGIQGLSSVYKNPFYIRLHNLSYRELDCRCYSNQLGEGFQKLSGGQSKHRILVLVGLSFFGC
jgi:hypothetical protein